MNLRRRVVALGGWTATSGSLCAAGSAGASDSFVRAALTAMALILVVAAAVHPGVHR